jgi:hypothetical protein
MKGSNDRSGTATTHDANSSMSSLDDIVDIDILTDRQGFSELDLTESQRKMQHSRENIGNLPSVNERMSEDALEDVHAFSDVNARSSNASRANSIGTGGGAVLEPLSEYDDEDLDLDDLDDIQEEGDHHASGADGSPSQPQVILTNMENLTLQLNQQQMDDTAAGRGTRGTGGSSLLEEAPSGPTA